VAISLSGMAQNSTTARKILDRTAAVVGNKSGASANFKISNAKIGTTSGSLSIKGNMFQARTPQAIVWYNGKTQWTYMKKTNEVNVSNPTEAQRMQMNPYTFISMYRKGYTLSSSKKGGSYVVHMKAQNKKRSVQEVYITVNARTYVPSAIKMRQNSGWTNITVSNFKKAKLSNSTFTFRAKDYPKAEIVDLR
jgi:outer membrane lipoprotein-sorting protein